ncbi:hypothetical protein C8035_v004344 [Colletotrichum spinosum]|uniref:Uncharacterized protein n=1 Tax=Colletotrichum spinosum TaxID=1347390 RepID=A0A4R8PR09_9PEZI|nr:hypothetical protein C8035_v004344 [Colletotrichum spinosum]
MMSQTVAPRNSPAVVRTKLRRELVYRSTTRIDSTTGVADWPSVKPHMSFRAASLDFRHSTRESRSFLGSVAKCVSTLKPSSTVLGPPLPFRRVVAEAYLMK